MAAPADTTGGTLHQGHLLHYGVHATDLPSELHGQILELELDAESRLAIDELVAGRPGWWRTQAQRVLRGYFSDFDANGLLDMYPMHVLSTAQARRLLELDAGQTLPTLLDVGAGGGWVTDKLSPCFDSVVTTEASWAMRRRLRRRGYDCQAVDISDHTVKGAPFDVVSVLNVIDRCERPASLLAGARDHLEQDGRLLLCTPLPYDPHVYDGPTTHDPSERLPISGDDWHSALVDLVSVLQGHQLQVKSVSRVPYVSGGDSAASLYVLDAALVVCVREEA